MSGTAHAVAAECAGELSKRIYRPASTPPPHHPSSLSRSRSLPISISWSTKRHQHTTQTHTRRGRVQFKTNYDRTPVKRSPHTTQTHTSQRYTNHLHGDVHRRLRTRALTAIPRTQRHHHQIGQAHAPKKIVVFVPCIARPHHAHTQQTHTHTHVRSHAEKRLTMINCLDSYVHTRLARTLTRSGVNGIVRGRARPPLELVVRVLLCA